MNSGLFRRSLPARNGRIHVARIELDRVAAPSSPFDGKDRRAAAAERIENDVRAS
jgi:hypothetical protein